jgi:TPP-dependent pyruvate/acetoin dehydrogenase alpha subunit
VYEATRAAVERARAGDGVSLIEVVTYRRRGHAQHDDQGYQPREEIERWAAQDPIDRYRAGLTEAGWVTAADLDVIDQRVTGEIDTAAAEVEGEPLPTPESALPGVYTTRMDASLWFRSLHG